MCVRKKGLFPGSFRFLEGICRLGVLALEAFHAPRGVEQLLLPGEEGVAVRANLETEEVALIGRARLEGIAAGAGYGYVVIIGVNAFFHVGSVAPAGLRSVKRGAPHSGVAWPAAKPPSYTIRAAVAKRGIRAHSEERPGDGMFT